MNVLEHYRRPRSRVRLGNWRIGCDCGWEGQTSCMNGRHVKTGAEVERDLEAQFRAHLPESRRVTYVLVDQRQVEVPVFKDGKPATGNPEIDDKRETRLELIGRGNFLMPWGTPCLLLSHYVADGVHRVVYSVPETGQSGDLPVGETRTADGKVFKLDSDA